MTPMSDAQIRELIALYNRGNLRAVIERGARILSTHPNLFIVHNIMGAANAGLGDPDGAVASFRTAVKIKPDLAEAHNNLGLVLKDQGLLDEAVECFGNAVRINPGDAEAHNNLGALLNALGRGDEAIACFRRALTIMPDHAVAHGNLGIALKNKGETAAAAERFLTAVRINPRDADALNNLAGLLVDLGRAEEAIARYRQAIELRPNDAVTYNNLGVVLKKAGRRDEAAACFAKAADIDPNYAEAHDNLGLVLRDLGRRQEAAASFARALVADPKHAAAQNNLGLVLSDLGRLDEAVQAFEAAIALRPNHPGAHTNLMSIRTRRAPLWHIGMMNDGVRNEAFRDALKASIGGGELVLEIGTGSGLLAMMAADQGAGKVITCEASDPIAEVAGRIVERNGFGGKVTVINKKSTDLTIPGDLPARADVIVAEILSSEFVGEGVTASLADAKRRLLKPGGKMIPSGGAIMIALLGDDDAVRERIRVDAVNGYDLSAFNEVVSRKVSLNLKRGEAVFLSDSVAAFDFDFHALPDVSTQDKTLDIQVRRSGACLGIVQWNRIDLAEAVTYENDPRTVASHWSTPIYAFDAPLQLTAGQVVRVNGSLAEDNVWFSVASPAPPEN